MNRSRSLVVTFWFREGPYIRGSIIQANGHGLWLFVKVCMLEFHSCEPAN